MKKKKLSPKKKKSLTAIAVFCVIQVFIVWFFADWFLLSWSTNLRMRDTKQATIVVEDVVFSPAPRGERLIGATSEFYVVSNNVEYGFWYYRLPVETPHRVLNEKISVGDQLSIVYYETPNGNVVIDARTDSEVLRSAETYYKDHKGFPVAIVIFFFIAEAIFIFVCYICVVAYDIRFRNRKKRKRKIRERLKTE